MTPLELFKKSADHILKQAEKSALPSGVCVYRHPGGLKCAAGPFIPDDKYSPTMEGKNFSMVNELFDLGYTAEEVQVLSAMQRVHDLYDDVDLWPNQIQVALLKLKELDILPKDATYAFCPSPPL